MHAVALAFYIYGVFYNPVNGIYHEVTEGVHSVTECATLVNEFLGHTGGVVDRDDGTYYLIRAECRVVPTDTLPKAK